MAQKTSVVVFGQDGQTIVREYIIDDILGYESDNFTAQGVAVANNATLFAAIDHKMVINFDRDGTFIRLFNLDNVNGVAFDALNNQLIVSSQSLSKVCVYDADTLELDRSYAIRAGADHLFFKEDTRELLAPINATPRNIGAYNHDLGSFIGNSTKLSKITAAEGITIVDDQLIAVSDAYFHPEGAIDLNQMLIYDLYDQIGYDYLNTDALDYWF